MKRADMKRNTADISGFTPLQYACVTKDIGALEGILSHNVDVNALNVYGETALHYAVKSGNTRIVELLLNHKADTNVLSVARVTPLHEACLFGNPEIVTLLVRHGADPYLVNDKGLAAGALCKNETTLAALNDADDAYYEPRLEPKKADDHSGDYNSAEICAFTPLMYAAVKGDHVSARRILLDASNLDQINKASVYGDTPMHLACQAGAIEVARALLEHRADIAVRNMRNQTAYDHAIRRGHAEMMRILSEEFRIDFTHEYV
jgi:ankyrin repeat protein